MAALDKNSATYAEDAERITNHYKELMGNVTGEMEDLLERGQWLNSEYATTAKETFGETTLGEIYTSINNFAGLTDLAVGAMDTALGNSTTAQADYFSQLKELGS